MERDETVMNGACHKSSDYYVDFNSRSSLGYNKATLKLTVACLVYIEQNLIRGLLDWLNLPITPIVTNICSSQFTCSLGWIEPTVSLIETIRYQMVP